MQVFDDVDGSLFFNWDAHVERFPEKLVETMFRAFRNRLEELAADGQRALAQRPVRYNPNQKVHCLNKRLAASSSTCTYAQSHLEQAVATPYADAVFDASSGLTFTFEKIVRLARSFAAAIVNVTDRFYKKQSTTRSLPGRPVPSI